jgi:16S rRNA (guanine527-N7)-methyltransferase
VGAASRIQCGGRTGVTSGSILALLQPYIEASAEAAPLASGPPDWVRICDQLVIYLELILKWNGRINLTAIRAPEEIVRRHFGESLFAGARLGRCATLLDFGSGAGFPGVPMQLLRPDIAVTLAESRNRKAAFLREVGRSLRLESEIWPARVEAMPAGRRFDVVAMRAVDQMGASLAEAGRRARDRVLVMGTGTLEIEAALAAFEIGPPLGLPDARESALWIARRR